jgi:hypothetical protein
MPAALFAGRVFRLLTWLYPPAFRRQFAFEMACDFDDATGDAWREGQWSAVVPLWAHVCRDLAWTIAVQWFQGALPALGAVPAIATTLAVFATAGRLGDSLASRAAATPGDGSLALLLFLATAVIVITAAVIAFTVGFSLLAVRRRSRPRTCSKPIR